MKKTVFLIVFFIIYTAVVLSCPLITSWDRSIIAEIQSSLGVIPSWFPKLFDRLLYGLMIAIPVMSLGLYFIIKKKWIDVVWIGIMPLGALIINSIFKEIVQRPRPPYELQMIHLDSFSYVSSHTLITFCLWAAVIYYLYKLNLPMKKLATLIGSTWVLIIGFSRCWLGVHNPTDVIGAFILGLLLFSIFLNIKERV